MKRRDFMTGVGVSILLALSKSNSQVPAQRPPLLRLFWAHADQKTPFPAPDEPIALPRFWQRGLS